jgi:NTP pyrophosphatase (non-canonical NTP hydrolase)
MKLSDYQIEVDKWASQYAVPYWQPHEMLARLAEETGEVARLINHMYGPKPKKSSEATQELGEELADVIFAVVCMANAHHINLDSSFQKVIDKAWNRDKDRFEKKPINTLE